MFQRIKHVHFVGIGGSGMSGIAGVLLTLGYKVTGSDVKATAVTDALVESGASVFLSHAAGNVNGAHVVFDLRPWEPTTRNWLKRKSRRSLSSHVPRCWPSWRV